MRYFSGDWETQVPHQCKGLTAFTIFIPFASLGLNKSLQIKPKCYEY